MRKLIRGIAEFREEKLSDYREKFARLALGQTPDALFIACSDSRVVPNIFVSTDPGDLFVVRNVGNLIPPYARNGLSIVGTSEAAAIEFALSFLNVSDVIICGHSECAAMQTLCSGREKLTSPNLCSWLQYGEHCLQLLREKPDFAADLQAHNRLSQINVLQQLEHLTTYPAVQERVNTGRLRMHGWWFDLSTADVYSYESSESKFVVIDSAQAGRKI